MATGVRSRGSEDRRIAIGGAQPASRETSTRVLRTYRHEATSGEPRLERAAVAGDAVDRVESWRADATTATWRSFPRATS